MSYLLNSIRSSTMEKGLVKRFSEWREEKGVSYSKASSMVGVSKGSLHEILSGKRKCPDKVLGKLAKIYEYY